MGYITKTIVNALIPNTENIIQSSTKKELFKKILIADNKFIITFKVKH